VDEQRPETRDSRFRGLGFFTASRDWLVARSLAGWAGGVPAPGQVARANVAAVRDTFAAFQELDTKYGGAYTHPALVQYIRLQAVPLLHAGCIDQVRRELGDHQASTVAISGAERALDLSGDRPEQRWTRFLDSAYLLGEMALCFIDLGQPELAERFATQSVAVNSGRHRRLVLSQSALATARGQLGDADGAVGALTDALDLMGGVQSSRTLRSVGEALTAVRSAGGPRAELARAMAVLGPKASGACCPGVPIPSSSRVR
jgi:hypothetical protein